jgi:stress response protein YsnF
MDSHDYWLGKLYCVWTDHTDEAIFLGVKTGWLALGKTHVVPAEGIELNEEMEAIKLPYPEDFVKHAPVYEADLELTEDIEREIYAYYRSAGETSWGAVRANSSSEPTRTLGSGEEVRMRLSEERLKVGKREVPAGGVRLRKVIRTEIVQQPVELKHEELVIEHVPPGASRAGAAGVGEEQTYIALHREEPVIQKEVRTREEVRVRKIVQKEHQTVSGQVRKEEVEVEARPHSEQTQPGRC